MRAHEAQAVLAAESLLGEMGTLRETLRRGLAEAERAGSGAAIVGFARELRSTLESYFDLAERMARRNDDSAQPALSVRVERLGLPDTCPHCGGHIEPVWE